MSITPWMMRGKPRGRGPIAGWSLAQPVGRFAEDLPLEKKDGSTAIMCKKNWNRHIR
jgi:hypothetical protein